MLGVMGVVHRAIPTPAAYRRPDGRYTVPELLGAPVGPDWEMASCVGCGVLAVVDGSGCELAPLIDEACVHVCARCLDGPHGPRLVALVEHDDA